MKCVTCGFESETESSMELHILKEHPVRHIDPGNEFSGPNNKKLEDLIGWIRRQPDANLRTGEGKLLLDEIDRLTQAAKDNYSKGYTKGREAGYYEHQVGE